MKAGLDDIMLVQKLNQGWSQAGCPWLACCTMSIMSSGASQKTFMRPFTSQTNPKATLSSVISVVLLITHQLTLVFFTKTITGYDEVMNDVA
jgi:hypothetical protein